MFGKLMRDMYDDLASARAIANPESDLNRIRRCEVTIAQLTAPLSNSANCRNNAARA
jgi:hypothetical protein